MIAETLVEELLTQTHDTVAEQACVFFKQHNGLADLKASQMNILKGEWEKWSDWPSLKENLEQFLNHQKKRDERQGVTGWGKIAADLPKTVKNLVKKLQDDVLAMVNKLAENVRVIAGDVADDVRNYFDEPEGDLYQQRVAMAKYCLARNFLACLYRLYRSRDVLEVTLTQGQLYSQGDCS
ncbi:hypothetical protein [Desulfobacca acetoxidans]|uniref:Uncharacterized protein n=1 Tax=Desulfobacca acetoxidans (strain ATCC 700848 / DSM 11109 / ASRB2) TaxID=880072 RepID=F2NE35_DESAR|nr:hypothetical protein [Desulfobacca acetoxidans]AEB10603.1 hypothetical protein Desac_2796 [Desulfobacca acetoxidans DSM 11109]